MSLALHGLILLLIIAPFASKEIRDAVIGDPEKPVFEQSRWAGNALLRPPYGARAERVIALLRRLV